MFRLRSFFRRRYRMGGVPIDILLAATLAGVLIWRALLAAAPIEEPNTMHHHQFPAYLSCGPASVDVTAAPLPGENAVAGKIPSQVDIEPGSGSINVADALVRAGGCEPTVASIIGADEVGNFLRRLLQGRFVRVRPAAAATQTRVSLLLPPLGEAREGCILTSRPEIDAAAALACIRPLLKTGIRLVLSSFRADDADLVEQLIRVNPGRTIWLPTASECRNRDQTKRLMSLCDLVWLNAEELALLTGHRGAEGVNVLRSAGVRAVVVTDGPRGVTAYLKGQYWHQRAFRSTGRNGSAKCGDVACGSFLAARDRGLPVQDSLRFAMAAAAMQRDGVPRAGWASIDAFAGTVRTLRFVAPAKPKRASWVKSAAALTHPAVMFSGGTILGIAVTLILNLLPAIA